MAAVPAGIKPIYVSNKQKEKYQLTPDVTHKVFQKGAALEETAALGFYSLFYEAKADIQAYSGDELLLVADPASKYGENFYFVLNDGVKAAELRVSGAHAML